MQYTPTTGKDKASGHNYPLFQAVSEILSYHIPDMNFAVSSTHEKHRDFTHPTSKCARSEQNLPSYIPSL